MRAPCWLAILVVLTPAAAPLAAEELAPLLVSHQGRLYDGSDQPVDGAVKMKFGIYRQAVADGNGNDPLWWESAEVTVQVTAGLYTLLLGHPLSGTGLLPATAFQGAGERWLGVTVDGAPLLPRMRFAAAPLALHANRAGTADRALLADDLACAGGPCVGGGDLEANAVTSTHVASLHGAKIESGSLPWSALEPLLAKRTVAFLDADTVDGLGDADLARKTHEHKAGDITSDKLDPQRLPSHFHAGADINSGEVDSTFLEIPDLSATYVTKTGNSEIAGTLTVKQNLVVDGTASLRLKTESAATFDCAGKDGRLFYDPDTQSFNGCAQGQVLRIASPNTLGLIQSNPGRDCADIQTNAGRREGTYWIDPNGATNGTIDAFQAYCEMTLDGGGWTRMAKFTGASVILAATYTGGVGVVGSAEYAIPCAQFAALDPTKIVARVIMGDVRDFFRPTASNDLCAMLTSYTKHSWTQTVSGSFVTPTYYSTHLGGSAVNWPNTTNDGRPFLSFWGHNGGTTTGGCCSTRSNFYNPPANTTNWGTAFTIDLKEL